ncbi:hypothetical protein [Natrinema halophilum]|uniref:Uncharacterized protein n=1 Tax=Natrinema halophilum TaxID=1699371 RepID=A0A7D5KQY2_9EURY|nr:hypothetical protein [Natrinema halophilum]QLG47904.1 hypothetical protein HYG82_03105 [Natrinema halophilum]
MTDTNGPHHDFEGIVGWETDEARAESVDDDRCVWCKWPRDEWDDDVDAHEIDTGEVVCSNCLGDQRRYKRTVTFDLFYPGHWADDDQNEAIGEKYGDLLEAAGVGNHISRISNANRYEVMSDDE